MKKYLWIIAIIVIITAIVLTITSTGSKNEINLGAIYSFSGSYASVHAPMINGAKIAVEEINAQGGVNGNKINLFFEDGKYDAGTAVTVFRKLRDTNNIQYLVSGGSGVTLALTLLVNQEKVIYVDTSSTTLKFRTENDFTFRIAPTAIHFALELAKDINKKNFKKVGIIVSNNDYGIGVKEEFKKDFLPYGIIVDEETFNPTDADFRTQILKLKEAQPQAVVFIASPDTAIVLIRQIKELKLNTTLFSDLYTVENQNFLNKSEQNAEGIYYATVKLDAENNQKLNIFSQNYEKEFGTKPNALAAQAYDAVYVIANAIKACNNQNTDCVRLELQKTNYQGTSGNIMFDSTGDIIKKTMVLNKIQQGKFVED